MTPLNQALRGRLAPASLALLGILSLAAGDAHAHAIFPSPVKFRVQGETSTVDVADCCGCSAVVGASVVDPGGATVSPAQATGTAVQFTVTSQTGDPKSTDLVITIQGVGTGDFGQICDENSVNPIPVIVQGRPETTAQSGVAGVTGDPVNTLSGELFSTPAPDLVVPGSRTLRFQRRYASRLLADQGVPGALGSNWRHDCSLSR